MSDRIRRALVTLILLVGLVAFEQIPLPGVDRELLARWIGGSWSSVATRQFGIGMLGVGPWLSAYVLVELGCMAFPSARPLRHSPEGRARMERYVRYGWLAVALPQAFSTAMVLEQLTFGPSSIVLNPGLAFRAVTVLTVVGGSAIIGWLCHLNARHGLGPGLLLAMCLMPLPELLTWWYSMQLGDVVLLWPALILVAGLLLVGLRLPRRKLPVSVVGLVPLGGVVSVATAFGVFQTEVLLGLIALTTLLLTLAFHPPAAVARRLGTTQEAVRGDLVIGAVLNGAFLLALTWGALGLGFPGFGWGLVFAAAFAWDLVEEFHNRRGLTLVTAWQHHSVHDAQQVLSAVWREGIPASTRGGRTRVLLHTFGPFVPIELLVEPQHVEQAQRIARATLGGNAAGTPTPTGRREGPVEPIPPPDPPRSPWDAPTER